MEAVALVIPVIVVLIGWKRCDAEMRDAEREYQIQRQQRMIEKMERRIEKMEGKGAQVR